MKNIFTYTLWLSIVLCGISCTRNLDDVSIVTPIKATIQISIDPSSNDAPALQQYEVRLENYTENYKIKTIMDNSGVVTVNNIIPGVYSVFVSGESSENGFTYVYNGNVINKRIVSDGTQIDVKISASKTGALVFKEIFYSGSKTPSNGSYFRDQFYEIYNNGNMPVNLDNLCIALLHPSPASTNMPVWPTEDNEQYVYGSQVWQIPGNGTTYPLKPGESIIIAQMADNHKKSTLNPSSPVNLLSAEFETLVKTSSIVGDNPAINMKIAFWPSPTPQWLTTVFGGAYAIFKQKEPIDKSFTSSPQGSTTPYLKINRTDIIDAVEAINDETKMNLKRIPASLDAGAATVNATYNGKSISRKIKEKLSDGRIIYMDTNNSTDDFEVQEQAAIRRNNPNIPEWNTWKDL